MKDHIAAEFEILAADAKYLKNACAGVKSRCLACIEAEGKHFEHLLKQTIVKHFLYPFLPKTFV